MSGTRVRLRSWSGALLALLVAVPLGATASVSAAAQASTALTVMGDAGGGAVFRDADGREVTPRGFNVSGSTNLYENDLLPFRSRADAAVSAQAMRDQTGANAVRFLISWEGVQPEPDRIDIAYLDRAVGQIQEFTDRGI